MSTLGDSVRGLREKYRVDGNIEAIRDEKKIKEDLEYAILLARQNISEGTINVLCADLSKEEVSICVQIAETDFDINQLRELGGILKIIQKFKNEETTGKKTSIDNIIKSMISEKEENCR